MVMSTNVDKIMAEALDLPAPLRAFVAEKLLESLDAGPDGELSAEWKDEILRRSREIDEGTVTLAEAEEVFARAYSKLP
jgi:putative addiction module component (TIGR02574 family)